MTCNPAYSPCAPELGWSDTDSKPVISFSHASSSSMIRAYPSACPGGAKGWRPPNSGQVTASISAVAFNFLVQDPRGIILVVRERSLDSS